jgi:hypothetical protein
LHFELWTVLDRENPPPGDGKLASIDPTRALYAWSSGSCPTSRWPAGTPVPLVVGLIRVYSVPFVARFEGEVTLHVPMYEPITHDERLTIAMLREAHRREADVQLSFRHSPFWGWTSSRKSS